METVNFIREFTTDKTEMRNGITVMDRKLVAEKLSMVLANSYMLYLKTQNYHWNVTGYMFSFLHKMFEDQYVELAAAIDVIAERIRALGVRSPGTFTQFQRLASIQEDEEMPSALEMVKNLMESNEILIKQMREFILAMEGTDDEASTSLLTDRMMAHEKNVWMLRSFLE